MDITSLKTHYKTWFDNVVVFGRAKFNEGLDIGVDSTHLPPIPGRPSTSFDQTHSDRTKRLKTKDFRSEYSGSCLRFSASMKFREEGNEKCAKLLKLS